MVFGQLVMTVVLCWGTAAGGGCPSTALHRHDTGLTNWRNTIQCLGQDDLMSLGIKSSAFLREDWLIHRMAIRMMYFQALAIL